MASDPRAVLAVSSIAFFLGLASFGGCLDVTPTKPYGCRSGDSGCAGSSASTTPSSGGSSAGGSGPGGSKASGGGSTAGPGGGGGGS